MAQWTERGGGGDCGLHLRGNCPLLLCCGNAGEGVQIGSGNLSGGRCGEEGGQSCAS